MSRFPPPAALPLLLFAFILGSAASRSAGAIEDLEHCYNGSAAQQAGQHDLAISFYNQCIEWGDLSLGNLAIVLYNRGTSRQLLKDFEGAALDYGRAIEVDPGKASAYNGRCWAYAMLRRPEEALEDCEESLRLVPDDPYTLDSRALVYWLLGKDDLARADLARARELNETFRPWEERFRDFRKMFFGIDR